MSCSIRLAICFAELEQRGNGALVGCRRLAFAAIEGQLNLLDGRNGAAKLCYFTACSAKWRVAVRLLAACAMDFSESAEYDGRISGCSGARTSDGAKTPAKKAA
jgi:hypothetical protein